VNHFLFSVQVLGQHEQPHAVLLSVFVLERTAASGVSLVCAPIKKFRKLALALGLGKKR
jgi:hypothetical protein